MTLRARLTISLGLSLIVAGLVTGAIHREQKKAASHFKMATVLRAKTYVGIGKLISVKNFQSVTIPEAFLEPTAVRSWDELEIQNGKKFIARIGLVEGSQLTRSSIQRTDALTSLAWSVPPNRTATTLELNRAEAVAGFINPGDYVHVYLTPRRQPGWDKTETRLILGRVRVLGVGSRALHYEGVSNKKENAPMEFETILVTLDLDPSESAELILAKNLGPISLSLCSPLDTKVPAEIIRDLRHL